MGRGRAKAKQTKVARELKYYSQPTDLTALQRELAGPGSEQDPAETDEMSGEFDGGFRRVFDPTDR